jgi:hypothetical protein
MVNAISRGVAVKKVTWMKSTAQSLRTVFRSKMLRSVGGVIAGIIGVVSGTIAIIDYFSSPEAANISKTPQHSVVAQGVTTPQMMQYIGRVRDSDTREAIKDAKISLEIQGVPPIIHTDSEGIYRFRVKPVDYAVLVRVEAKGYEVYTRYITLSPDNPSLEDISLVRLRSGIMPELIPPRISPEKEVPKRAEEQKKATIHSPPNSEIKESPSKVSLKPKDTERFKGLFAALATEAENGAKRWRDASIVNDFPKAKAWVHEYNQLRQSAQLTFKNDNDPYIEALQELKYSKVAKQASEEVFAAAKGIEAYLTYFIPSRAFKTSATILATRAANGTKFWPEARAWVAEYNRLRQEAKLVFPNCFRIDALPELKFSGIETQGEVARAAKNLEFVMSEDRSQESLCAP